MNDNVAMPVINTLFLFAAASQLPQPFAFMCVVLGIMNVAGFIKKLALFVMKI